MFTFCCLLSVVRFVRYFGENRVVSVRVRGLVPCLARCQVVRLRRTRLRSTPTKHCLDHELNGTLLTIIHFRLVRGVVNALRSTFQRAYRLYRVGAREVFTTTAFRFTRGGRFVVCLLRECVMVLSTLREFLRLIRLVVVDNGRHAYLNFEVLIGVLRGDPDGKGAVVDKNSPSRLVGRRRAATERIIRGVYHLVRFGRGNEFTREGIVTNSRANRCFVRRASPHAFNEGGAARLHRRNGRHDLT